MTTVKEYIDLYNKGELRQSQLHSMIEAMIFEIEDKESEEETTIESFGGLNYKTIFGQKEFYNGHGQLQVDELSLTECLGLIKQLGDNSKETDKPVYNIFYLSIFPEKEGYSGNIHQSVIGDDILWLTINNLDIEL
jgi:hypothetical protein